MAELLSVRELVDSVKIESAEQFAADAVAPGRRVNLHFSLSLAGGELVSTNFDREPATCVIGDGSLLEGFEKALFGMKAGEEICLELAPAEAFGASSEDNIQNLPRFRFPPDLLLEKGLMVEFAGSGAYRQAGMVMDFDSSSVRVDFNHPLAGRSIIFRARILHVGHGDN